MVKLLKALLLVSPLLVLVGVVMLALDVSGGSATLLVGLLALSIGLGAVDGMAPFRFTAWMIAVIALAMLHPEWLLELSLLGRPVDLNNAWLRLLMVQAVMFGMGTQMHFADFAGVVRTPHRVAVGLVCQFTIMPLVGLGLAVALGLPDEIAAGVVLIGCCSSGLASNVMVYLARADLALSVTLTAVATLLAPVVTPAWMKVLAGPFVEVDFLDMMLTILKIVVVPIGAALLHDLLKSGSPRSRSVIYGAAALGLIWLLALAAGGWAWLESQASPNALNVIVLIGFVFGAVVFGVVYHHAVELLPRIQDWMPVLSMVGILYFTGISTAGGRDELLSVGWLLLIAAVLHNSLGYLLGYWLSRLVGMNEIGARTIALEVGMQNGAMGVGIADAMGKLSTVGLAPILFSPWMNVSGSLLANFWRRRPQGPIESPTPGPAAD